jgi:hypothetical protein
MMQNAKPQRKEGFRMKELGNETLLYQPNGKAIHVLNPTALRIWELCDGQHTAQEMEQVLRAEYQLPAHETDSQPVPQADIAADIARSLQMFFEAGLLEQLENQPEQILNPKP